MRRGLAVAGAVLLGLWVTVAVVNRGEDDGEPVGRPADTQIGLPSTPSMPVGVRTEVFVDSSRPTPAVTGEPEQPSRQLVTTIYYPATGPRGEPVFDAPAARERGPYPLIVFSHGFGLSGRSASSLLGKWAGAGYVIAAPSYPLTSSDTPGGPRRGVDDTLNQPLDATFVLTQVLFMNEAADGPLEGLMDPARVGSAGYSMGGGVTLGMSFNSCCRDERIKAAVVMAGTRPGFVGQYFAQPGPPVLFVHGDSDGTVPYEGARRTFADATSPKLLLTILGGDHGGPYGGDLREPGSALVVAATTAFFDHHLKGRSEILLQLNEAVANQPAVARLDGG